VVRHLYQRHSTERLEQDVGMLKTPLTTPKEGLRAALFALDRIDSNQTSDELGLLLINIDDLLSYAEKMALKEEE